MINNQADTISGYLSEFGFQYNCPENHKWMTVNVDFINNDGMEDQTQFDIKKFNEKNLILLFHDFCRENNFATNSVIGIEVVRSAESYDDLLALEEEEER